MLDDLATPAENLRSRLQSLCHAIERVLVFEARDGANILRAARVQRAGAASLGIAVDRRAVDIGSLALAGTVTLEITVLIGLPLNFANIFALPVMLGLGVAFKIYFVMARRAGTTDCSRASRAPCFSAHPCAACSKSVFGPLGVQSFASQIYGHATERDKAIN